jgi:hypothetical protein
MGPGWGAFLRFFRLAFLDSPVNQLVQLFLNITLKNPPV